MDPDIAVEPESVAAEFRVVLERYDPPVPVRRQCKIGIPDLWADHNECNSLHPNITRFLIILKDRESTAEHAELKIESSLLSVLCELCGEIRN
jgi:hypothetical protein